MTPPDRHDGWHRTLVDTFVTLADTLVADFDVVEFLQALTEGTVELGLAAESGILLADPNGELQVMAASRERTRLLELFQLQSREGPCLDAWRTGRPVTVPDLAREQERWPTFAPEAISVGFRTVHAIPISLRETRLGALNMFGTELHDAAQEDQVVTQGLAAIAAVGLVQHRTHRESQVAAEQLQNALQSRIAVEQAKGILAERNDTTIDDAFEALRAFSRDHNRRLTDVALAVVAGTTRAAELRRGDHDA